MSNFVIHEGHCMMCEQIKLVYNYQTDDRDVIVLCEDCCRQTATEIANYEPQEDQ